MRKVLTVAVLTINIVLHSAAAVSLRVYPRIQLTGGSGWVRLTLSIEPDIHNRAYCVVWEGPNSGQTCRDLDGDRTPKTQPLIELKDLPEGHYEAQANVGRDDNTVIRSGVESWDIYGPDYSVPDQ